MGLVDSVVELVPKGYRRDVMVLVLGGSLAIAWSILDARIARAEEGASEVVTIKKDIADLKQKQSTSSDRIMEIMRTANRTEDQVNLLVQTLLRINSLGQITPAPSVAPVKPKPNP